MARTSISAMSYPRPLAQHFDFATVGLGAQKLSSSSSLALQSTFSIRVRFKTKQTSIAPLFSNRISTSTLVFGLNLNAGSGKLFAYHSTASSSVSVEGSQRWADDRWHNAWIVSNGTTVSFYVDGRSDGSGSMGIPSNTANFHILYDAESVAYTTGALQEIEIYNGTAVSLSDATKQHLYGITPSGLTHTWALPSGATTATGGISITNTTAGMLKLRDTAGKRRRILEDFAYSIEFDGTGYLYGHVSAAFVAPYSLIFNFWTRSQSTSNTLFHIQEGANLLALRTYNNQFLLESNTTSTYTTSDGVTGFNDGAWHQLALVKGASTIDLYLDGRLEVTSSASNYPDITGNCRFMLDPNFSSFAVGGLQDIQHYLGTALTATQIQNRYFNALIPTGLTDRFKCDEGPGNPLINTGGGAQTQSSQLGGFFSTPTSAGKFRTTSSSRISIP